jgi:hypothetical protein
VRLTATLYDGVGSVKGQVEEGEWGRELFRKLASHGARKEYVIRVLSFVGTRRELRLIV